MNRQILSLVLVGLIVVAAVVAFSGSDGARQPIAFSHKKHAENNVTCGVCHKFYDRSAEAGLPGVGVCNGCHEDVVYVSLEKEKLLRFASALEEIPWRQVYEVPQHVLFSHERHVGVGKIGCSQCHGDVAKAAAPITKQAVKLGMDECIDCHRRTYANPNECLMCHR